MKTIAILAAAGLTLNISSASAADLGGNCCADLEERVAELEATTARNPRTGESVPVAAKDVPKVSVGASFKNAVNS